MQVKFWTSSKYGDFSTSSSYECTRVPDEVEGINENLASLPLPRKVVFHPKNDSLFDPNFQAGSEFSIDAEIEPEMSSHQEENQFVINFALAKISIIGFGLEISGKTARISQT